MVDTMTMAPLAFVEAPTTDGKSLEQLIGITPLVRMRRIAADLAPGVDLMAKAEWHNPGGSIKDRAALSIIRSAVASGQLFPGKTLIDASSGNTGIGYAMVGAAMGYDVKLVVPASVTPERIAILRAYGAELVLSDGMRGADGAIDLVREMVAAEPERYYYADQYSNPANWKAHFYGTGPEIWWQTAGQVTHFVAGLGTSGTMMGVGQYLKSFNPGVHLVSLQPDGPLHGLEGIKHMKTAKVPPIYEPDLVDENRTVKTEAAYEMARRLAREEGLFVGVSAAAAMVAALEVASELTAGTVVTVFPDGGYKYMSEKFWEEQA